MPSQFQHEKLRVYQDSIKFVVWATDVLENVTRKFAVWDQLDRAATSVPLNIAQGNGKSASADRCRSFDIARGSALESAACLDVLLGRGQLAFPRACAGKELLRGIVSMLVGLIRTSSPDRLHESGTPYGTGEHVAPLSDSIDGSTAQLFDHEKLKVYQESLRFINWTTAILKRIPENCSLWTKLDRSSTSIVLSIAEGNGKFTRVDRCRFFEGARSAALGTAACLDALTAKGILPEPDMHPGKEFLLGIIPMLGGLIRSNSSQLPHSEPVWSGD
jgi:four helix bundle protein